MSRILDWIFAPVDWATVTAWTYLAVYVATGFVAGVALWVVLT
jgi:hypothetical protein